MDLQQKLGIAGKAIESISRHDDEDARVRLAALDAVAAKLADERARIEAGVQARIDALALPQGAGREGQA